MVSEKQSITQQLQLSNKHEQCADCNTNEATCSDIYYGVLICRPCSEIHKTILSRKGLTNDEIKPIKFDGWLENEEEQFSNNKKMACDREILLPPFMKNFGADTHEIIKREFIQYKYEDKIFRNKGLVDTNSTFMDGVTIETLMKRMKNKDKWIQRLFILNQKFLKYYKNHAEKAVLLTTELDVFIEDHETYGVIIRIAHHNTIDNNVRAYYVQTKENDDTQLFKLYTALVAAKYWSSENKQLEVYKKSGILYKVGEYCFNHWVKRRVTLVNKNIVYYKENFPEKPQGSFELGSKDEGYSVENEGIVHLLEPPTEFTFQVTTPSRVYKFCAENEKDRTEWIQIFRNAIALDLKS